MFSLHMPSKTFLLGEYVVLDGGPGLVLTTSPDFTMTIHHSTQTNPVKPPPFHLDSAAGCWLKQQSEFFEHAAFEFFDPHQGQGGFGASSAEFIGLYAAQYPLEKTITSIETLLARYWSVFSPKTAILPSGADIVAQALTTQGFKKPKELTHGNIVYWHRNQSQWDQISWSFSELSYCLIRTGYKHPTHQSLKKLSPHALKIMSQWVEQGYAAFAANDALALIESVKAYAQWMEKEGCLLTTTQTLLDWLLQSKCVVAAKGCGALGADVVLALLWTEKLSIFLRWLADKNLNRVAYR